jgi:hypothetical protein
MMKRLSIVIGAVAMLAIVAFFLYSRFLRARSEGLLQSAYEFSQQRPNPTVRDLRQRFRSRLKQVEGCPPTECAYTVTISNKVLAALHLAPYTEISSYFHVKNGVVLGDMVNYTTVSHGHSIVAHVQVDICSECQGFAIHPWSESTPLDTNGLVEIGSQSPPQSIRTVLLLNTACLTGFGGCKTVADLLPGVWKRTPDGAIACTIVNDRGMVQTTAGWP